MQQVETFNVSRIEQLLYFKKFCRRFDIQTIIFDGDDTLWKTQPIFTRVFDNAAMSISNDLQLPVQTTRRQIAKLHNDLYTTHSVSLQRWNVLVDQLTTLYPLNNTLQEQLRSNFEKMFDTPLSLLPGTKDGLDFLTSDPELPSLAIVTHANPDWTWKKYRWLNLDQYFDWDDVYTIDDHLYKDTQTWSEAMNFYKVKPENCLVVGDSPRADINPVNQLGAPCSFLIRNPCLWSVHNVAVNETKTKLIDNINDLRYLGQYVTSFRG